MKLTMKTKLKKKKNNEDPTKVKRIHKFTVYKKRSQFIIAVKKK